jgi:hypothetical protein
MTWDVPLGATYYDPAHRLNVAVSPCKADATCTVYYWQGSEVNAYTATGSC